MTFDILLILTISVLPCLSLAVLPLNIVVSVPYRYKALFTPNAVTYSSVPSRDSVRIFLLLAALNDVDIQSADV